MTLLPPPVLQALAWGLVDREVVAGERLPGDGVATLDAWVRRRLVSGRHGLPFELADEALRQARAVPGGLSSRLTTIARGTLRIERGVPRVADEEAWDAVCRIVDPDLIALAHEEVQGWESGAEDFPVRLCWPPSLRADRTVFHSICQAELAEVHAHLGGSLPTPLLWALLVTGALAPEVIDARGWDSAVTESSPWIAALVQARTDLNLLAGATAPEPYPGPRLSQVLTLGPVVDPEIWPLDGSTLGGTRVYALLAPERATLRTRLLAESRGSLSPELRSALERYVRTRNAFNVLLSQRPGQRGLNEFRTFYDRRSALWCTPSRGDGGRRARARAASALGMELLVESWLLDHNPLGPTYPSLPLDLELRTCLPLRGDDALRFFQDLAQGARRALERWRHPPLGLGIVHHVIKSAARNDDDRIEEELSALWSLLEYTPELRPLIVGIDAASDELACPPRSFAAGFRLIRERLDRGPPAAAGPPVELGFTFHAGEDFRDLLTGLRHVDEAAHLLEMRPGDRLGHALALSWPVEEFYIERAAAFPLVADHALDLLWCAALLRRHGGHGDAERDASERLEAFLTEQGAQPGLPIPVLIGLLDLDAGHDPRSPRGQRLSQELRGRPEGRRVLLEAELLGLLGLPLESRGSLAPRPPRPRAWRALVEACQLVTRERVMRSGLFIEINPSSNRVVGGFSTPDRLPYTRISRPGPAGEIPNLPLCIGTDDAGVFHTSLRREYELVGRSALAQGFAEPHVHTWLDELRRNGRRASFLRAHAPRGEALHRWLGRLLPELAGRELDG